MTKSHRKATVRGISAHGDPPAEAADRFPTTGWEMICLTGLFLSGFLITTEAAELGHHLWLTTIWLGFAAVTFWLRSKVPNGVLWKWTLQDLGVFLMIAGHVVSGISLFPGTGDVRSAINVVWQWIALGTIWALMRIHLGQRDVQATIVRAMQATLVSLSLLGIWQHLVWFPQQAAAVQELLDLQSQVTTGSPLTPEQRSRYTTLSNSYGAELSTLDSLGRQSYLARIRDSVEPIGRFALANSLAGILLVGCLIGVSVLLHNVGNWSLRQRLCWLVILLLLMYCLILTKSRTATWVALPVGMISIGLYAWRSDLFQHRFFKVSVTAGVAVLALLIIVAVFTGGLDAEVISEAPKSLQYRLEYWTASTHMLADHSLLGIGPGNFRQNYVRYKLAGASEEVIDPHNLILDLWANGGIISLVGLIIFLTCTLLNAFREDPNATKPGWPVERRSLEIRSHIAAYVLVGLMIATLGGYFDPQLLPLCACALLLACVMPSITVSQGVLRMTALSSGAALIVHLLASGGMEMLAIVQVLFLLAILSWQGAGLRETAPVAAVRPVTLKGLGAFFCLLLGLCAWTGLRPVFLSKVAIDLGRSSMMNPNYANRTFAKREFEAAIQGDPIAPAPYQWLAQWTFAEWSSAAETDDALFHEAIHHQQSAIARDPVNSSRYKLLGEFWDAKFRRSKLIADAEEAVAAHRRSVELYPNDALRLSNLALALERAEQYGAEIAARALTIDDLNLERGHYDKTLPPERRADLEAVAAP